MASGVKVDEVVKLKYDDIKKKKSYRYLIFYIKDEKMITVEKVGDRGSDYNQFLGDLTGSGPDDCR
jgi:cofilin